MFKLMKSKKGFTLVEVIVVLVILAILAAILIPSMTGWIDKAKNQSVLVEARSVLLAAQTLASEEYAVNTGNWGFGDTGVPAKQDVIDLSGIDGANITESTVTAGKVTNLVCEIDGLTCTYNGTEWKVEKK